MRRKEKHPGQLTLLDLVPLNCAECGGTILPPTIGGVPRGTCHCPSNLSKAAAAQRVTDWTADQVTTAWVKGQDPRECCMQVVAQYEGVDAEMAAVAKQRGGVALFCPQCHSRVTFSDGKWQREGPA